MEFEELDRRIYAALFDALDRREEPTEVIEMLNKFEEMLDNEVGHFTAVDVLPSEGLSAVQVEELIAAEEPIIRKEEVPASEYQKLVSGLLAHGNTFRPTVLLAVAGTTAAADDTRVAYILGNTVGLSSDVLPTFHDGLGSYDGVHACTDFTRFPCGHVVGGSESGPCPLCLAGSGAVYRLPPFTD